MVIKDPYYQVDDHPCSRAKGCFDHCTSELGGDPHLRLRLTPSQQGPRRSSSAARRLGSINFQCRFVSIAPKDRDSPFGFPKHEQKGSLKEVMAL